MSLTTQSKFQRTIGHRLVYRIFINLLLFVGVVTLSSIALAFVLSITLMIGVPIWCGFTGHDFNHFVHEHLIGK